MSNGLSQAEIDALLSGGSVPASDSGPPADDGGSMSQADIDALLGGGASAPPPADDGGSMSQADIDALLGGGASAPPPANDGGSMSQADIDALLGGGASAPPPANDGGSMSQADIDALLGGGASEAAPVNADISDIDALRDEHSELMAEVVEKVQEDPSIKGMYGTEVEFFGENEEKPAIGPEDFDSYELDAMGEIGNISMGTAATTLNALLNRKVSITTPTVSITTMREIAQKYPQPFVAVEVSYTRGLLGNNVLFLREKDVKIITDLLMGGDGSNTDGELGELHLSAISEVMNQMMGSSATSLSKMISMPIDISPPKAYTVDLAEEVPSGPLTADEPIIQNSFAMEVEGLIESEIMQIMPLEFSKVLIKGLIDMQMRAMEAPEPAPAPPPPKPAPAPKAKTAAPPPPPPPPRQSAPPPHRHAPPPPYAEEEHRVVDVRPAVLDTFDDEAQYGYDNDNIDLLMDVPLSVTVELGKSKKFIREILDFNVGSIIVLDKLAGELVDVIVNGKLIAKGEVVVIDDSYGARITDIVSPSKRLDKN